MTADTSDVLDVKDDITEVFPSTDVDDCSILSLAVVPKVGVVKRPGAPVLTSTKEVLSREVITAPVVPSCDAPDSCDDDPVLDGVEVVALSIISKVLPDANEVVIGDRCETEDVKFILNISVEEDVIFGVIPKDDI